MSYTQEGKCIVKTAEFCQQADPKSNTFESHKIFKIVLDYKVLRNF